MALPITCTWLAVDIEGTTSAASHVLQVLFPYSRERIPAWIAAHVDEDYQVEQWGQDAEAQARRAARYTEFMACCRFLSLAQP